MFYLWPAFLPYCSQTYPYKLVDSHGLPFQIPSAVMRVHMSSLEGSDEAHEVKITAEPSTQYQIVLSVLKQVNNMFMIRWL